MKFDGSGNLAPKRAGRLDTSHNYYCSRLSDETKLPTWNGKNSTSLNGHGPSPGNEQKMDECMRCSLPMLRSTFCAVFPGSEIGSFSPLLGTDRWMDFPGPRTVSTDR